MINQLRSFKIDYLESNEANDVAREMDGDPKVDGENVDSFEIVLVK